MSDYLFSHYKGKYRVLADYDWETNDFPRDEKGNVDSDFNDFYIPGKKGVQIRHAGRDKLGCYIFSMGIARNILSDIYIMETHKTPPKKIETLTDIMIKENIIEDVTLYDGEILFIFKASHIDDWAKIFKLKTSGAKISPLSIKNLPKSDYKINTEDEEKYNNITSALTKEQRMSIPRRAIANIVNKLSKKDKKEMKQLNMKPKQYIHYKGLWGKLLKELEREIENETN